MTEGLWYGCALDLPAVALAEPGDEAPVSTIQLARVGRWEHPKYGALTFDEARFTRFIANFDARVRGTDLALDVEHVPQDGAAGWFINGTMRMGPTERGTGLFVDVRWTPKGMQLVADEEYRYVSLTFKPEWTDPETQQTWQDVVFGAAITTDPFIKGMAPVQEGLVVRLSEFHELTEGGSRHMAGTAAEGMRSEKFIDSQDKKLADGEAACPACKGNGKVEGKACPACGGTGKVDEEDIESLAERFHAAGKQLAERCKGKTGAPMVRNHLAATAKLMEPLLEKLKGGRQEMSEQTSTAEAPAQETIQLRDNEEVRQLTARLQEVEEARKRDAAELARLREDRRRAEVVKLSEGWFPRKGEEGFRFKPAERDRVVGFLMQLSAIDEKANDELIRLSEGATVEESSKSRLFSEFISLVNAIPEPKVLHLSSEGLNEGDQEEGALTESQRLHREAMKLSETEKIPMHVAARRARAKQRQ